MARSPKLNEKMKEERRELILNNALRLFATKGLAATKIADIAREAAMSQGLMYLYYNSTETNELMGYRFLLLSQAAASTAIPEEAKETIRVKGRTHYDVVESIFRQGQAIGQFKCFDPGQMTLMLWTSISGLAINKAVFGPAFEMPDPSIILGMFMKGEEKC